MFPDQVVVLAPHEAVLEALLSPLVQVLVSQAGAAGHHCSKQQLHYRGSWPLNAMQQLMQQTRHLPSTLHLLHGTELWRANLQHRNPHETRNHPPISAQMRLARLQLHSCQQ